MILFMPVVFFKTNSEASGVIVSNWYTYQNEAVLGPYTDQQISSFLSSGVISMQDKICRADEQVWRQVREFNEFRNGNPAGGLSDSQIPPAVIQSNSGEDIRINCPHCTQHYSVKASMFQGQIIVCHSCGEKFSLTMQEAPAAAQAAPAPQAVPQVTENYTSVYPTMEEADFSEDIPEGDITCPHCWKSFSKENVCYISSHPELIGDAIAGEFEQKRFLPTVYHSNGLPLDAKGMPCTDMACPHCHLRIPGSIVDLDAIYFSIAGAPSSGKSYFLTSLVHDLRRSLPRYNYSFYDVDPVINRVINGYEDKIFMAPDRDQVVSLPKTQQIGSDFSNQIVKNGITFELPKPFIFRLQSTLAGGGKAPRIDHNLVLYDNAGEHFQPGAETIANPATIHLTHSNGIIFIFDPLNDANMRKDCDQRDPQAVMNTKISDQTTLFAEMVNRIRRHGNLNSSRVSDIPLVIAVGKYDAWKNIFPKNMDAVKVFTENPEDFSMEMDMNALLDVSFALREMMLETAPGLVAQAESFFRKVYFVPVSSFGCLASKSESGNIGIIPSQLNPFWVNMPLFLLLAENGFITTGRNISTDGVDTSLVCKILDGQIIFRHPVNGQRVALPGMYGDAVIEIGTKRYKMPTVRQDADKSAFSSSSFNSDSLWR